MYIMTSSCPHCGAPIYVPAESSSGEPMLLESGVWLAVQPPTYSCECRKQVIATAQARSEDAVARDQIRKATQETYRASRRPGGVGSEYSAFGKGPRED